MRNDAYRFIQDKNLEFTEVNLQEVILKALELNLMVFTDNEYRVLASIAKELNAPWEEAFIGGYSRWVPNDAFIQKDYS